ncbi:ankyrin repeat domain-containing protein [bacterium]|nr:MAG: ankyrin repeat domain-containing protein [bacterium]
MYQKIIISCLLAFTVSSSAHSAAEYIKKTSLHGAAKRGDLSALDRHAKHNSSNINQQARPHGWTPLHYAAFYDHTACVECLISYDADTTIKDKHGKTALDLARQKGYFLIVEIIEGHER